MILKKKTIFLTVKHLISAGSGFLAVCAVTGAFLFTTVHAEAGDTFVHTHTDECVRTKTVLCDYPHEKYSTHEIITRHCEYCGKMTQHSHYLTNYRCPKTGHSQTVAGQTACLVCHRLGYSWGRDEYSHYREDKVYVCGAEEGEPVARVTLSPDTTEMTGQDVTLTAGVTVLKEALAGSGFLYSWDQSAWSGNNTRTVQENGTYTVWVKNQKGEIAETSVTVSNIDKIPPVIEKVDYDTAGMTREKIKIHVVASDNTGVTGYSFDEGATWSDFGSCTVEAGKICSFAVRDAAGNIATGTRKREDFPMPPEPETVKPVPAPQPAPAPAPVPERASGSGKKTVPQKEKLSGQGTDRDSRKTPPGKTGEKKEKTGRETEAEKKTEIPSGLRQGPGYMVPKVIWTDNNNPEREESDGEKKDIGKEKPEESSSVSDALFPVNGETERNKTDIGLEKNHFLLSGAGIAGLFFLCFLFLRRAGSGVLYALEGSEETPSFRKIRRLYIRKNGKGCRITLPEDLADPSEPVHFRFVFSKYWRSRGRDRKVYVDTGERILVADMEECIDFVL